MQRTSHTSNGEREVSVAPEFKAFRQRGGSVHICPKVPLSTGHVGEVRVIKFRRECPTTGGKDVVSRGGAVAPDEEQGCFVAIFRELQLVK